MLDKQDLQAIKELIEASENRTHAYIERAVIPQLQLLAEGHQTLLETLTPKNRWRHWRTMSFSSSPSSNP